MHDWKYFVILLRASWINVSENYNLHIVFYIISLLKFRSLFKLVGADFPFNIELYDNFHYLWVIVILYATCNGYFIKSIYIN
jgi:hypothetical protein